MPLRLWLFPLSSNWRVPSYIGGDRCAGGGEAEGARAALSAAQSVAPTTPGRREAGPYRVALTT